jgi:small multidrug resistance pump
VAPIFGTDNPPVATIKDSDEYWSVSVDTRYCSLSFLIFLIINSFKAMHALPVGFAYATYSGLTVTGVVLFALLKFNQVPNIYGLIGIILIIIGVVMVNYLGRLN